MTVFFTSDTHLFHRLVSKIRWQRANPGTPVPHAVDGNLDPSVINWHTETLADNWDNTVGRKDQVFVLGDLAMTNTRKGMEPVLDWFRARNGEKILVPGNHDPIHAMHSDSHKWDDAYREVFKAVELFKRRTIKLCNGTTRDVMLSHYPYLGDRDAEDRDPQYRLRDCGNWLLHGHLHSHPSPLHTIGTRQIDVGVDAWKMAPVALETIVAMIDLLEGLSAPELVK